METKKRTILPTFLSLRTGCKEDTSDFNDGIYYPDYIRGFLADLSYDKRVRIMLSMFQIVPGDFIPLDDNWENSLDESFKTVLENYPIDKRIADSIKNQKIIRIDSGTFINNGICCGIFRECKCDSPKREDDTNRAFCYKQDSRVGIFADPSLSNLNVDSPEYEEQLRGVISAFNQKEDDEKTELKLKKYKGRIYVHYTCSVSLFEETMFPIYAKGRFVACLMLGQMAGENYDKNESFKAFLSENHTNAMCLEIKNHLPPRKLSKEEWENMRDAIIERIVIYEKRLEDKINHRTKDDIERFFTVVKDKFKEKIKDVHIETNNQAGVFFAALSDALSAIHNLFSSNGNGFIRMFALPIDDENKRYVPIGWSGIEMSNPNKTYRNKGKQYYFTIFTFRVKNASNYVRILIKNWSIRRNNKNTIFSGRFGMSKSIA